MEQVQRFKCELCGTEFQKKAAAVSCEKICLQINDFKYKYKIEKRSCNFTNGGGYVQRDIRWWNEIRKEFLGLIKSLHPQIYKESKVNVQNITGFVGRYLNDSNSKLYGIWAFLYCICPKCYKEWGQPYYARHCVHVIPTTPSTSTGRPVRQ